jgi:hypothetical protein
MLDLPVRLRRDAIARIDPRMKATRQPAIRTFNLVGGRRPAEPE